MSTIMDLKLNHKREHNTADLKIYRQLTYLKKHGIEKYFFEIPKSVLDIVDETIFKVQNSIILILKVGKLMWTEYIDKNVFAALTYFGFHLEQKLANIYKFIVFSHALFVGRSGKLKVHRANCQTILLYASRFSTDIVSNGNIFFLLFFLWFLSIFDFL